MAEVAAGQQQHQEGRQGRRREDDCTLASKSAAVGAARKRATQPSPIQQQSKKARSNSAPANTAPRFIGVYRKPGSDACKYTAQIRQNGLNRTLGVFEDDVLAAQAYDEEARKLRGDRAHGGIYGNNKEWRLNFPSAGEVAARDTLHEERIAPSHRQCAIVARRKAAGGNSSPFVGVRWVDKGPDCVGKWQMTIGKPAGTGAAYQQSFGPDEEEACAKAYDNAAREIFGNRAHGDTAGNTRGSTRRLNFPTAAEVAEGGPSHPDAVKMVIATSKRVSERQAAGLKASKYHGIHWSTGGCRWSAVLTLPNGHRRKLGTHFVCEESAAKEWDRAVRQLLGQDAHGKYSESSGGSRARRKLWLLNFPTKEEQQRLQRVQSMRQESERLFTERTRHNTSEYVGVVWCQRGGQMVPGWRVHLLHSGRSHTHPTTFAEDDEVGAAHAYDDLARKLRGKRAHGGRYGTSRYFRLNFPTAAEKAAAAGTFGSQSQYTGLAWSKRKWSVSITHSSKQIYLGTFERDDEEAAARCFDAMARKLRGAEAHKLSLNFPTQVEMDAAAAARGMGGSDTEHPHPRRPQQRQRSCGPPVGLLSTPPDDDVLDLAAPAVGRRLEYKFEVAGQERWFPGVITRVSASTDWYDVSFDDGEKCCVRIVRIMQGVVWRWAIGTYGDDREGGGCARQAAVAACSSTTHAAGASARGDSPSARAFKNQRAKTPREQTSCTVGESMQTSFHEEGGGAGNETENAGGGGGARGSEELQTSVFASEEAHKAMRNNTWQTDETDEPLLEVAAVRRLPPIVTQVSSVAGRAGMGAFASRQLAALEFIGEYAGEIIQVRALLTGTWYPQGQPTLCWKSFT
jgi:hypothetical protein